MAGGITQLWRASGETCPHGTVPIRRTTEEEALRVRKLVEGVGESPFNNHEYAIGTVEDENLYYGAEATYNVWAPAVANNGEYSLSQFWLTSGTYATNLNTIEAGWQVLYGKSYPRFFIYWTADAYQNTGCYDLECAGFVQTNNDIVVGGSINPTSTYDGQQSEMKLLVWKDHKDGNWWLEWDSTVVGYWPSSLFSHLAKNATSVQFGGEIVNNGPSGVHTATQMGSGYFPEEGYRRAAYTRNLQVVDATNTLFPVQSLSVTAGKPNYYTITEGVNSDWGTHFFFGGPRRSDYAFGTVEDENLYYGAEATYNVWAPAVANNGEFSLSQFWLTSGTYATNLNTIEAGWQVLYGNSYPRFFIYWTADAYQSTGCYDLTCPGFVQTNNDIVVGGSINPTSTYDGQQSEMKLLVWKDHKDGNWWLEWDSTVVGYWPSSLFSHLADSATSVQFGGEIVNNGTSGVHTATQMGSGYFPEEGYRRAAYTRNLQVVDANNTLFPVQSLSLTAGKPNCYNITKGVNSDWGTHFFFGGPGRSDVCP
uniref:Neprosin PEP catalytic domain-containing protein n=2 Tax=Musa acuminata subsp. malaccensis TaxID=214687 RepID=A0A804IKT3_MUSAM